MAAIELLAAKRIVGSLSSSDRVRIITHYELVGPAIDAMFGGTPLTTVSLPEGFGGPEERVAALRTPLPSTIPTAGVRTRSGLRNYLAASTGALLWSVRADTIGFESWAPIAIDSSRARFGRIAIEPTGNASLDLLRDATRAIIAELAQEHLHAVTVLDGASIVLWIPFIDAPDYETLRAWLHGLTDRARSHNGDLFEHARNDPPNRIRLSVRTNAPGMGTALPNSLRCLPGLPVVTPLFPNELRTLEPETMSIERAAKRFATVGDVFAREVERIGKQRFDTRGRSTQSPRVTAAGPAFEFVPRADVIQIAYQVLGDGLPRSAAEIIDDATAHGVWPKNKSRKHLYGMLATYVAKTLARGREPLIVHDADHRFRLNHAPDDNPDPIPRKRWTSPKALIERLRRTSAGGDAEAFEIAVCDAFVPLGFMTTHLDGAATPAGFADAILGPRGYRFVIRCNTDANPLQQTDVVEAANHREQCGAQYAILIAPAFGDDTVIAEECIAHRVSAWTVDDLCRLLEAGANAFDVQALLEPGVAENELGGFEWNRNHGPAKRAAVVCDALRESGWNAQLAAVDFHSPAEAPIITEDGGMLLVDEYLRAHGSHTPCTRSEIQDAFAYLTNPRVGDAQWVDASRTGIVISHV